MASVNMDFAGDLVDGLAAAGLRHVCVSPGSRSGPLAIAFARHPALRTWVHVDERCSGFFALGLAKHTREPVAVLTTSGTAAAELHAAVLEAHHSRTPLVVLTADRPPEMRDSGANQSVDQARLFGTGTRWTFDPGPPDEATLPRRTRRLAARAMAAARGPVAGPAHLNLPFREPLLPAELQARPASGADMRETSVHTATRQPDASDISTLAQLLSRAERPFVHAGSLPADPAVREALRTISSRCGVVVHAEPQSHLRSSDVAGLLRNTEALLRDDAFASEHTPDVVVRIGAPPTSRTMNEWLACTPPAEVVLLDPDAAWLDPDSLATNVLQCDVAEALRELSEQIIERDRARTWRRSWEDADRQVGAAVDAALRAAPLFEAHAVRAIAAHLSQAATVVVGSSMAIRDVDWFWPAGQGHRFIANRGASGIDGFISTVLGAAAAADGERVLALCGDLALYHDMNGLLAARKYGIPATFVVLNNDGGGIFSFLREAEQQDVFEELFATPTGLDLARVAALYDCEYRSAADPAELEQALGDSGDGAAEIIDVRFSRAASVSGHRAVWAAASSAMRAAPRVGPGT